jgi:hypothetical protein
VAPWRAKLIWLLAKVPESAPLIGLGAQRTRVCVDLDDDSPHILVSAGTVMMCNFLSVVVRHSDVSAVGV